VLFRSIADAQIYLRIKADRESVKAALYNADDCIDQTVDIARTALRDILAAMPVRRASIDREQIGAQMCRALDTVTENWGVEVVRCRMKEIEMPKDVQEIMHQLVKAEHEKLAASDFAAAAEINADGIKRAEIKKAEGEKQARILAAEAEAKAMRIISEAARQHFTGNAQLYRVLEAAETALKNNTKIILQDTVRLFDLLGRLGEPVATGNGDDKLDELQEQDD
jgi:regulator of protease activity HflC (stomatin/prohibitin superfamily)